jgi:hypothetical protein
VDEVGLPRATVFAGGEAHAPTAAAAVDQRLRADLDDDLAARLAGIDVVTDAALQR